MKKAFANFRIDVVTDEFDLSDYQFHGRALEDLEKGQIVYLTNNRDFPAKITKIITYGTELSEISKAMGCGIHLKLSKEYTQDIKNLESDFLWVE